MPDGLTGESVVALMGLKPEAAFPAALTDVSGELAAYAARSCPTLRPRAIQAVPALPKTQGRRRCGGRSARLIWTEPLAGENPAVPERFRG